MLLQLAVVVVAFTLVCQHFADRSWFADIISSFTLVELLVAIAAFTGLLVLRAWRSCLPAALCLFWAGLLVAPYTPWHIVGQEAHASAGRPIRVMLTNVFSPNPHKEAVLAAIKDANPDVVCAQEIDKKWEAAFAVLEKDYPHRESVPRPDNFGIGVWSKFPILYSRTRDFGDSTVPAIILKLDVHGVTVNLLALHTMPPLLGDYADTRNRQMADVPEVVREMGPPFVLIGDLNTTMWSPHYQTLLNSSGLTSAREGRGFFPSWPVMNSYLSAVCPLDHILVSQDITVTDFARGPNVGSDHLPVYADVVIPLHAPS